MMATKSWDRANKTSPLLTLNVPNPPGLCSASRIRILSTDPTAFSDNASSPSGHSSSKQTNKQTKTKITILFSEDFKLRSQICEISLKVRAIFRDL